MAAVVLAQNPGTVVTRENDVGVVGEAQLLDFVENAARVVVDLLDNVAVKARLGFSLEVLRGGEQGVSQIDKERPVFVFLDELNGLVRVALCQGGHVGDPFDHLFVADQVDDPVIARWRAEKFVEPLAAREEFGNPV